MVSAYIAGQLMSRYALTTLSNVIILNLDGISEMVLLYVLNVILLGQKNILLKVKQN